MYNFWRYQPRYVQEIRYISTHDISFMIDCKFVANMEWKFIARARLFMFVCVCGGGGGGGGGGVGGEMRVLYFSIFGVFF